MKKNDLPSKIKFLSLMMLSLVMMVSCYVYRNYYTYKSIKVDVVKNATVEYGTANYNINDFIENVEGEIISVKSDIDTGVVGEQEVVLEVKKDNITKEVPIVVSVVDTAPPVIKLKEEKVTITSGDEYDLTSNIESVDDAVDGVISYSNQVDENSTEYYDFTYDASQIDEVGTHEITVNAKDKNGNLTVIKFNLEVVEPPKPVFYQQLYSGLPANAASGDLVSIAYSYIGAPYISGSNGPYGFDCSGFVQYVYSCAGISVSRSSYTQAYDGVGVSYAEAQPGDILSWGHDGVVTHSALYVGDGMMIHATNPSQGVMLSSVSGWENGSYDTLMAVRRIQ